LNFDYKALQPGIPYPTGYALLGGKFTLGALEIQTNQGQDWSSSTGWLAPGMMCWARKYGCTSWNPWSNSMTESSLNQLITSLKTQTLYYQQEALYQTYIDSTTASGFLCGYAGEVTTVPNAPFNPYNNDGVWPFWWTKPTGPGLGPGSPEQALSTFGLMFMLPLNPNSGFSIPPASLSLNSAQPLASSNSLMFSTTFNDLGCNQAGALIGTESLTIQTGTTWSLTASQSQTYGQSINNQWNVGASLQIGNNMEYGQLTASVSYTSSSATQQQSTSAYSTTNQGSSTTSSSLTLPLTCPVGPKYARTVPCTIKVSQDGTACLMEKRLVPYHLLQGQHGWE